MERPRLYICYTLGDDMDNETNKMAAKFLEKFKDFKPSPMLCAALNGDSSTLTASQTAKQLDADLKAAGKDSFTIADIREAQRKVFEGV